MGALRDRVDANIIANQYINDIDAGNAALAKLVQLRQIVVDALATIQGMSAYTAAEKADAQAEAVALRDAIISFANSIAP